MRVVIDANVLIAANQRDTHPSKQCAAVCARTLLEVQQSHLPLEDEDDLILDEYKRYCSFSGQPGPGDRFFVWFMQRRWTEPSSRVKIDADPTAIIPEQLRVMDPSDHKWIAVYLEGNGEVIYNATDSDWKEHADAFARHNVQVQELCDNS